MYCPHKIQIVKQTTLTDRCNVRVKTNRHSDDKLNNSNSPSVSLILGFADSLKHNTDYEEIVVYKNATNRMTTVLLEISVI